MVSRGEYLRKFNNVQLKIHDMHVQNKALEAVADLREVAPSDCLKSFAPIPVLFPSPKISEKTNEMPSINFPA